MKTKEAIVISLMAGALASCHHEDVAGPTKVSSPPTGSFVTSPSGMVLVGATVVTLTATGRAESPGRR